jgi:hypothetical protein
MPIKEGMMVVNIMYISLDIAYSPAWTYIPILDMSTALSICYQLRLNVDASVAFSYFSFMFAKFCLQHFLGYGRSVKIYIYLPVSRNKKRLCLPSRVVIKMFFFIIMLPTEIKIMPLLKQHHVQVIRAYNKGYVILIIKLRRWPFI